MEGILHFFLGEDVVLVVLGEGILVGGFQRIPGISTATEMGRISEGETFDLTEPPVKSWSLLRNSDSV